MECLDIAYATLFDLGNRTERVATDCFRGGFQGEAGVFLRSTVEVLPFTYISVPGLFFIY